MTDTWANQAIVDAVRVANWEAFSAVPSDPSHLSEDFERVMAQFDDEGCFLATSLAARYTGPHSARFMLAMARSAHMQAAAAAAIALRTLPIPPAAVDVAAIVRFAVDPLVRTQLYLTLGCSRDDAALPALRRLLMSERDGHAAAQGALAAARLGDSAERRALMVRVQQATAATVMTVFDELLYVGDVRFAKGLVSWLDQFDSATRMSHDEAGQYARVCDVAVWTAVRLGVALPVRDTHIDNYDDATLQVARTVLQQLADP